MEVILVKEVDRLGQAGKVVTVKDGYARNYLFSKGLAVPATEAAKKELQERLAACARQKEKQKSKAVLAAQHIRGVVLRIPVSVGHQGKLHGAVTVGDLVEELKKHGVVVQKHQIESTNPLAQLGAYELVVKLHPEVSVPLKVQLVRR